jgi:endonuclease III
VTRDVRSALTLPFAAQPDLAATMDIQIPALAWEPRPDGRHRRSYHLDGHEVRVEVTEADRALRFRHDAPNRATADRVAAALRAAFPTLIGDLNLGAHPALRAMRHRYHGVIVMRADPFEALVLTMLSQNRTGETVRAVFPALAARAAGVSPAGLAALSLSELIAIIRPAGPYKAPRIAATAARVLAQGEETFRAAVVDRPAAHALAYLESFPGVGHKTAACVLVFAARATATLPVDTHLFRVADRLGLARHDGVLTKTVRDQVIGALLGHGPDLALAHFLFLLVGRTACAKRQPACPACFLRPHCRHAAESAT